jgi:hypothetical protein
MLVWQSGGEQKVDTLRWQLSRRARLALEYSIAIVSALASSYLILRLGL